MKPLTEPSQLQIDNLQAIQDFIEEHGYPPTRRELGDMFGTTSPSTAHEMINRLERHGLITVARNQSRSLRITESGMKALTEEL